MSFSCNGDEHHDDHFQESDQQQLAAVPKRTKPRPKWLVERAENSSMATTSSSVTLEHFKKLHDVLGTEVLLDPTPVLVS